MPTELEHSIVVANDLLSGRTVYLTEKSSWSEQLVEAQLLVAGESRKTRLNKAKADECANLVIDPYLVEIGADLSVRDIRERIRTTGPSILPVTHSTAAT